MNKLIQFMIVLITMGLMASFAWAKEAPAGKDKADSYQELSPAEFFGYSNLPETAPHKASHQVGVSNENTGPMKKNIGTNYEELSPGEFFGYETPGPALEKPAMSCCEKGANCRYQAGNMKNTGAAYEGLSPAEMFYGSPIQNTDIKHCSNC